MALYRQRDSQYWWVSIYVPGKRRRMRFSTGKASREEAALVEAAYRSAVTGNSTRARMSALLDQLYDESAQPLPLDAVWRLYKADGGAASSTTKAHWDRLRNWLLRVMPAVTSVQAITRSVAFAFADAARAEVSAKTWNNLRGTLGRIWVVLERRAAGLDNVWRAVPTANASATSRTRRPFTDDEVARLLAECRNGDWHPGWYGASLVALYTGLRQSDIIKLTWHQFDKRCEWLTIRPGKTQRHGIAVTMPVHATLRAYLLTLPRDEAAVFPGLSRRPRGGRYGCEYPKIVAAAGISDSRHLVDFHSWRHTFRTSLAAAGVPADVARKLGGWRTDVAERVYDHDLTQARAAIDRLPGLNGNATRKRAK